VGEYRRNTPDAEAAAAAEAEDEAWDPGEKERVRREHIERVGHAEEVAHVGEEVERGRVAEPRRGHEEQRRGENGHAGESAAAMVTAGQVGRERERTRAVAGATAATVREVGGEIHGGDVCLRPQWDAVPVAERGRFLPLLGLFKWDS
jgi:hypothetical protein